MIEITVVEVKQSETGKIEVVELQSVVVPIDPGCVACVARHAAEGLKPPCSEVPCV